ncbi:hypothetical protein DFH27DRAFT_225898 [Peziza echinospora]|nr:hypothetical protein DFH27DRAFT_225898 [Peziza echinospora]
MDKNTSTGTMSEFADVSSYRQRVRGWSARCGAILSGDERCTQRARVRVYGLFVSFFLSVSNRHPLSPFYFPSPTSCIICVYKAQLVRLLLFLFVISFILTAPASPHSLSLKFYYYIHLFFSFFLSFVVRTATIL